ncbi:MAG: efflux transporter outer membrane subunit [Bacteroidaceae bacterium]|nr:efflux transporter outer membrane subunit [Bacteroidaceae bacterium]
MVMKKIIILLGCTLFLSSCGIYTHYKRPDVNTAGLFRDSVSAADTLLANDTTSFGNLPWRSVFTDPDLCVLVDSGLQNNKDLLTASLTVKEAQAQLMSARLAFLPSFALSPSGTVSSWDKGKASQVYSLPVQASWSLDLFGSLTNAKRSQKAVLLQSKDYQQAVRSEVIANIANSYYTLLMLDRQLEITDSMSVLTKDTWRMMIAQMKLGMVNEAAVRSSEANYYSVKASIPELQRQIRTTENALCLLLGKAPQTIKRGKLDNQTLPQTFSTGVGIQLLSNRPDVRSAEMNLASCYYQTNAARSAFYPSITITGSAGWTNSSGISIVNPGKLLASAVGSLTQPLFAKGKLIAALKVAKAEQQKAYLSWQYAILNAGSEVSNALMLYQSSTQKSGFESKQVESLQRNVVVTKALYQMQSSSYLEVVSAQQSLLSAQLSKISDDFYKMQAVVNLYYALGGGR